MSSNSPLQTSFGQSDTKRKKKIGAQRQAHLFNVPDDIMMKVTQKRESNKAGSSFGSSIVGPSSLPAHPYPTSPSVQGSIQLQIPTQPSLNFENYSDTCHEYKAQSVIVNNYTRDINDVIAEIINRPHAPIVDNDPNVSLVCPLSMVPIACPGRGHLCHHSQCFDIREFILLQMDDDWKCPICGIPISFESLRFDPLFFKQGCTSRSSISDVPVGGEASTGWDSFGPFDNNCNGPMSVYSSMM